MEAKQVRDLMEAYASVYQEKEEVSEDLQQKVGQALDAAARNPVVQAIGAAIKPVGQGRKTPTKDGNWRPVVAKEETEEVDEATKLAAVARRRAEELGRKRRSTKEYKQGLNRRTGSTERRLYDLSNRQASRNASLETQKMSGDTGAHGQNYADRIDKRDPEKNPKHNANKENINASYEYDLFDYLLEYLVAEGYADTNKAALAIMANMSEEWKQDIVEDIRGAITYNPNTPIGKLKRRIKGSTPEKREARTRAYQGNRSDSAERYGASQHNPYDDNKGDIPSLRGK